MRSNYVARIIILAALVASAAACDPYPKSARGTPSPATVFLVDQALHVPAIVVPVSGSAVQAIGQPSLSLLRIRLNKTVNGSTVQASSNPAPDGSVGNFRPNFCTPAAGITMTDNGTDSVISACYDSTGPDIVVTPAAVACGASGRQGTSYQASSSGGGRIENNLAFQAGHTYVLTVGNVADHDGQVIPTFTVTVEVPAALNLDSEKGFRVATKYDPDTFLASDYSANVVAGGVTGPVVPPGPVDEKGLAVPSNQSFFFGVTTYGPDVLVKTDKPLCRVTGTASASFGPDFCKVPGTFDGTVYTEGGSFGPIVGMSMKVAGIEVDTTAIEPFSGVDVQSDYFLGGDNRAFHVFPLLPLEDDQEYTVTLPGSMAGWVDRGTPAVLGADKVFTFRSAPGAARIQFVWPKDGETGFPPTTDLVQHANVAGIGPFVSHGVEFVASRPLKVDGAGRPVGTIEVKHLDGANFVNDADDDALAADVAALDTRNRAFAIGAVIGADRVRLKGGRTYQVTLSGLQTEEATPVTLADKVWAFTTLPNAPAPLDFSSGIGSLFPNQGTVTGYNAGVYGAAPLLETWIYGEVDYDQTPAGAVATPAGTSSLWAYADPVLLPLAGGATVTLVKQSDGSAVGGTGGFLNASDDLALPPWADSGNGQVPASVVGFLPDAPLAYNASYTLTIDGLTFKDGSVMPKATLPFTTRPFIHRRSRTGAANTLGNYGQLLVNGAQNIGLGETLRVEFRGNPSVVGFDLGAAKETAAQAPIVLTYLGTKARPDYKDGFVPITIARATATRVNVTPVALMEPNDRYRLVITNRMKSIDPAAAAAPVVQFEFSTQDAVACLPP